MPRHLPLVERRTWAWTLSVALLKPVLLAVTRREWEGGTRVPRGGCVLVVNHVSHVDPLTTAHYLYDHGRLPRYLAKQEVFDTPAVGAIVRNAGQIPVARATSTARHAFTAAVRAVRAGECVVVYPEGTLTRDPDLWPMRGKTGAARIALETGAPVIPLAQWGPQDVLPPYRLRPRLWPRTTVRVRLGDPVDLSDLVGQEATAQVLAEATERIMAALTGLVAELRGEEPPSERFDPRRAGISEKGRPRRVGPQPRSEEDAP